MKKLKPILIMVLLHLAILLLNPALHGANAVRLQQEKIAVMGGEDLVIERFGGVCEDPEGNVYLLDRKAFKVYKFSPMGKQLAAFGQKGEGPGDLMRPYAIDISAEGEVVITESLNFVSFFDGNGKFLRRTNLGKHLGGNAELIKYAGPEMIYFAKMFPEQQREMRQILVNRRDPGKQKVLFTLPDISINIRRGGQTAAYWVRIHECTPNILFHHCNGVSAAGYSKKYHVRVVDKHGEPLAELIRDFKPQAASPLEKKSYAESIEGTRLPEDVKKAVIKHMPETKNIFDHLLVSPQYVFVFRTRANTLDREEPLPVDVFSLDGTFHGTLGMENKPALITGKYMYTPETGDEDNLSIVKYSYSLSTR